MKVVRSVLLMILVLGAIILSSRVWFKFPFFIEESVEENYVIDYSNVDVWKVVRPNRYLVSENENKTYISIDNEEYVWKMILEEMAKVLNKFSNINHNLVAGEVYPDNYLLCEFKNKISADIFFEGLNIDKSMVKTRLPHVYKIAIDIDKPSDIYIYNGDSTVILYDSLFDGTSILSAMKKNFNLSEIVADTCQIGENDYDIAHVQTNTALNPVFVKAEFNVNDSRYLDSIAKNFFGGDYDYVRRSVEQNGNVNYVYKNEKVLKITSEGLFDFFDAKSKLNDGESMYDSLKMAIGFSNKFIDLPDDFYLLDAEVIQKEGVQGYRFSFTYKINDKPVLFSRVRDNLPLEIEVVEGSVVSYKRLLRDTDKTMEDFAQKVMILGLDEVIEKNIKNEENEDDLSLKILNKDMLGQVDDAYLAYFDRAQKINRQQLIVVWVIEIGENTYIFNAITGSLLEQW